jgi:hypothetical protein
MRGAGRAYWLRLTAKDLPVEVTMQPELVPLRIEPGASVDIPVAVSVLTALPDPQGPPVRQPAPARPQAVTATLVLFHAFGAGPTLSVPITWSSPQLVASFKLTGGRSAAAVAVRLHNTGNQDPGAVAVQGYFIDSGGREHAIPALPPLAPGELAPGKEVNRSLMLPDELRKRLGYYVRPVRVRLEIRDSLWYRHLWQPESGPLYSLQLW